jgi:hypothetical protein
MTLLSDSIWIDFGVHGYDVVLHEHQRPYHALRMLPFPDVQEPQMISFIGQDTKTRIARDAFNLGIAPGHKNILLNKLPGRKKAQCPIFIADSGIYHLSYLHKTVSKADAHQHVIHWHQDVPQAVAPTTLAELLHTRILIPFSTVVCIFADDFDGLDKVAKLLASWLSARDQKRESSSSTMARIFVLTEWHDPGNTFDETLALINFMKSIRTQVGLLNEGLGLFGAHYIRNNDILSLITVQLGDIKVMPIPKSSEANTSAMLGKLRARILHESDEVHSARKSSRVAFSARHLEALLHLACAHFAKTTESPFNFIRASRIANPLSQELPTHVSEFLEKVPAQLITVFFVPVIASALSLDAFPPGAYSKYFLKNVYGADHYQNFIPILSTAFCIRPQSKRHFE